MTAPVRFSRRKLPHEQIELARRLRAVREAERFSLQELADECGLTKSGLRHLEIGSSPVSFDAGHRICQRLDLNQRWLITGEEPKRPFVYPSDLGSDSAEEANAKTLTFYSAYTGPLKAALDHWHSTHPMELLIKQTVAAGMTPALRRMSDSRLESFLAEQCGILRRTTDTAVKRGYLQLLSGVISELERRCSLQKSLTNIGTMSHIRSVQIEKQLKAKRRKLGGLTQAEAAKKWGIPIGTLQAWEQGKRTPRGLARKQLEQILRSTAVD